MRLRRPSAVGGGSAQETQRARGRGWSDSATSIGVPVAFLLQCTDCDCSAATVVTERCNR